MTTDQYETQSINPNECPCRISQVSDAEKVNSVCFPIYSEVHFIFSPLTLDLTLEGYVLLNRFDFEV